MHLNGDAGMRVASSRLRYNALDFRPLTEDRRKGMSIMDTDCYVPCGAMLGSLSRGINS